MTGNGVKKMNEAEKTSQTDPVAGKTFAEVLGEVVWLMTQTRETRRMEISEIERLIMPGILLQQFHIQYAQLPAQSSGQTAGTGDGPEKPNLQPISVEIFAMVSDAVSKALLSDPNLTLTLQDWRSGTTKHVMLSVSTADKQKLTTVAQ